MIEIFVETDVVEQIATWRAASNRRVGRIDGRADPNHSSVECDYTGAAGELGFARVAGMPDSAVKIEWDETDGGIDFDIPGLGAIDVKATGRGPRLLVPQWKYPPPVRIDWYVMAIARPMGSTWEVQLVGYVSFAEFDRRKVPFAPYPDRPAWAMKDRDLQDIRAMMARAKLQGMNT